MLVNNYFGRQFNSLNDIGINPRNKDVYFTDTLYGYLQDFRPTPGLRNQVYRLDDTTGALTVVADGFVLPNGECIRDTDPKNPTSMLSTVGRAERFDRHHLFAERFTRVHHGHGRDPCVLRPQLLRSSHDVRAFASLQKE